MLRAENVGVTVEVEDDRSILVVLDRFAEAILVPWQDAFALAEAIKGAVDFARRATDLIDTPTLVREQAQISIGVHRGLVSLVLAERSDRVRYTWRSAEVLAQALRIKAQDVQFVEQKRIRMPTLRRSEAKSLRW